MLLSPAHHPAETAEATTKKREQSFSGEATSSPDAKKLKRSASGEVTSSTDDGAAGPNLPHLKIDADDSPELNAATQAPSAASVDESKPRGSGWSLFRMLIPAECDVTVDYDKGIIDDIKEEEQVKIRIHPVAGVRVVMVWAKEDPHSPTSPALEAFIRIHKHLLARLVRFDYPFHETKLLVPAEQAKSLIHSSKFQTIEEEFQFLPRVYLTDKIAVSIGGDVIIELPGVPEHVNEALRVIAYHLRQIPVDEDLISKLDSLRGIPFTIGDSTDKSLALDAFRSYEVQHSKRLPLPYVDKILGENGANIEAIQGSSLASVIIQPLTDEEVYIRIHGDSYSDVEAVERVMEDCIGTEGSPVFESMMECALHIPDSPMPGERW